MWGRRYAINPCPRLYIAHLLLAGLGAMTEWKDIVKIVVDKMQLQLKP